MWPWPLTSWPPTLMFRAWQAKLNIVFYLLVRPTVRSSVRPSVRLLPNLRTRYFENELTDFDANWNKWSTGRGHETVKFESRRSKVKVIRARNRLKIPFSEISQELSIRMLTKPGRHKLRKLPIVWQQLGWQRSKVKVTRGRRYIWRPGRGIVLDPLGRIPFLVNIYFILRALWYTPVRWRR